MGLDRESAGAGDSRAGAGSAGAGVAGSRRPASYAKRCKFARCSSNQHNKQHTGERHARAGEYLPNPFSRNQANNACARRHELASALGDAYPTHRHREPLADGYRDSHAIAHSDSDPFTNSDPFTDSHAVAVANSDPVLNAWG